MRREARVPDLRDFATQVARDRPQHGKIKRRSGPQRLQEQGERNDDQYRHVEIQQFIVKRLFRCRSAWLAQAWTGSLAWRCPIMAADLP
jgi:hypothetical protein